MRSERVFTLCFHGIGAPGRTLEPGEERFWIDPRTYVQILDAVAHHARPVHLTFDDANASDHRYGLPGLVERGLTARFFVITDRLDTRGSLSSREVVDLRNESMTFGTHGASHTPWTSLARRGELGRELDESTSKLVELTGAPVTHAAFPQGLYNRDVLRVLHQRGFTRAYTVDEGTSRRSAWLRSRYTVTRHDSAESVLRLLDRPDGFGPGRPARALKLAAKRWR